MYARLKTALILSLLVTVPSCTDQPKATLLRFRPALGKKQVMRIAFKRVTSIKAPGEKPKTSEASYTFGFEPREIDGKDLVRVRVTIQAIQVKRENASYDSNEPHDPNKLKDAARYYAEEFSRFIKREFTMSVSPTGEIADTGLDELFLGLAEDSVNGMDQAFRERLGDGAQKAIEKADAVYGSRDKRILAGKQELELGALLPRRNIECLLRDLVCRFSETPVQPGDSWSSSSRLSQFVFSEAATTCKLSDVQRQICTIDEDGRKSPDGEPGVLQVGSIRIEERSGGSYQATSRIDRKTGQLLSRRLQLKLAGECLESNDGPRGESFAFESDVMTTVETMK